MAKSRNINNIVRHSQVSEKVIEKYLFDSIKALGGVCLKYSNPNMAGFPDRVVLLPDGITFWVELKSKGKKPSEIQQIRIKYMMSIGHDVFVIDSREGVDDVINEMTERAKK